MPDMQIQRSDIDGLASRPGPPESATAASHSHAAPALAVGLAALLLVGPGAASTAEAVSAVHEQFATAFTPGQTPVDVDMPEIRLPA